MTQDDIIKMAQEAGIELHPVFGVLIVRHPNGAWIKIESQLTAISNLAFAAGAAAEREECAKIADEWQSAIDGELYQLSCAEAIRARGQHD